MYTFLTMCMQGASYVVSINLCMFHTSAIGSISGPSPSNSTCSVLISI